MGTHMRKDIDAALEDLEQLAGEIRVKLHLAGMDARDLWTDSFEPRLGEARKHAREASAASKTAIDETLNAVREFARAI